MRKNYPGKLLFFLFLFISFCITTQATVYPINLTFSGTQETPPNNSTATGTVTGTFNDVTDSLIFTITFSGLSSNVTAAHIHGIAPPGIAAGVLFGLTGFPTGATSGSFTDTLVLTAGQRDTLKMGLYYFNIHTANFPGGEIRAQIFLQDPGFDIPVITCPTDTTTNADAGICSDTLSFNVTVAADTPTASVHYRIGNTAINFPYGFPLGTTTVIATALNAAGFDTCSFNVTVKDAEPPVVTCPSDTTLSNDPGECGAIVNYPPATATDNCSNVTITYSDSSGSFFPVGTTTVTVTATDSSGNSATCSFTITVNDTEPPVINDLKTDRPILWPPNHKMRNVNVSYTSTDNCPGPITCTLSVSSNEPDNGQGDGNTRNDWQVLNDNMVRLRAERSGTGTSRIYSIIVTCTDQYGNSASDTTEVRVPHNLYRELVHLLHPPRGPVAAPGMPSIPVDINRNMIVMNEEDEENLTLLQLYPNPSRNYFTLNIATTNYSDKISVRIIDLSGRIVENRIGITGNQILRFGQNLRSGMYIAEIRQGKNIKSIKILKQE